MRVVLRYIDIFNKYLTIIMGLFLGIMSVVIFFQVFSRFFLGLPLPWSEELARFLMIYTVFFGAAVALRHQKLIAIEVIAESVSKNTRRLIKTVANGIGIVFFIIVLIKGLEVMERVHNQVSAAMQLPMSVAYAAIPIGAVLLIINGIAVIIELYTVEEGEAES
ncbi:TRAP-type C4-dicarboxylate transport system permease small subunit [Caldalkalibacillus uzonensis]|uniref:TRAP-type C4-dicarboxylate transport system permease small subunit n=1 Tax=Caldalkalibacillus uzonensis TaxID=353224 RepID=A0ABU0CPD1_9BACI|nr:TRAP transporter small permease [Caldalkalibacillus uzonensis]MDQ0338272.1 TRAP-type C4-dicarboxylate transport system permease small subunit [Caldalkalibacillus uzonensis]